MNANTTYEALMRLTVSDTYALLFVCGVLAAAITALYVAHVSDVQYKRNRRT